MEPNVSVTNGGTANQAPAYQAPVYQASAQQAPVYQAPGSQAPVYQAPVYQAPAYQAPVYQAPVYQAPTVQVTVQNVQPSPVAQAPVGRLNTNRGLAKYILLSIVTFGIYGLVAMSSVSNDINIIASRYDGKKTMHYCLLFFLISWLTLGIAYFVWYHNISRRIGNELNRRNIQYSFGPSDFWLWNVLGSLLLGVGPFIYLHRLFKAMNKLSEHYNVHG